MDWFKEYFGNISELAQALGALAAVIGVWIAYRQLRSENEKRDEEIKFITQQTEELTKLYNIQDSIRRSEIRPFFVTGGGNGGYDGCNFDFLNKGKRAYKIVLGLTNENPYDEYDISYPRGMDYLDTGAIRISIKYKNKDLTGYQSLKDIIFDFSIMYEDEDRNIYMQDIKVGQKIHIISEQTSIT
jgi:hypothetical protein